MKHELASEKLLELAYGELSPREARDVEAHVAGCERCREELARIGETRSLMANLPIEPAPERGERIIMAAAREAAEARSRRRPTLLPPWLWAGSIGAAAAVVVAVVSWQLTREPIRPSLRQDSELMGSARPAVSATTSPPAVAPVQRPVEQPTVAMKEEAPAKREPVAKAKAVVAPPPAAEAKGSIGFTEDRRDRAEETEAARGAGGPAIMGGGRGSPLFSAPAPAAASESSAMADKAASGAAPARSAERKAASPTPTEPGGEETRTFARCLGERRRIVERDGAGRVIRYVRIGEDETIEHRYASDGRLVSAVVFEGGERHVLPLDTPGLVRDARDAGIDAPPRCEP